MTVTIDTLGTAKKLKAAGMSEAQAEALSEVLSQSMDGSELVTKTHLREQFENFEARLTLKLSAIMAGLLALFAAFDRFFA
jgi:hypothetical protein